MADVSATVRAALLDVALAEVVREVEINAAAAGDEDATIWKWSAGGAEEELICTELEDALEMPTSIEGEMLDVAINRRAEFVEVEKAVGKALNTKSLNVVLSSVKVPIGATSTGAVESVLVAVEEDTELGLVLIVDSDDGIGVSGLYELYWDVEISA